MLQVALDSALDNVFSSEQMNAFVAAGIKLYAVNTSVESLGSENPLVINVLRQELPIKLSLEVYVEANLAQLESFLDLTSEVSTSDIPLGSVPSTAIFYTANIPTLTGATVELANIQYLLIDPDDAQLAYVVTVGMPVSLVESLGGEAIAIAETFRLLSAEEN